jgi:hypothetical protein
MVSSVTTSLAELGNTVFGGGGQKFASISAAQGDTRVVVAAVTETVDAVVVATGKIRVLALAVTQAADASATFEFLQGSTAVMGVVTSVAQTTLVLPFNPAGWFETAAGAALNVTVAGTNLTGCLVYEEVAGT